MFGSTSQKPGGFSFGAPNNTANNLSTPSLNFSNNNTNSGTKPTGFTFGNINNPQQNNSSSGATTSLGGFSFNKPASTASTNTNNSNTGFSFGNSNATNATPSSKPSLFGNSSTNPAFGSSVSGLGMGLGQAQSQPSNQNQMQSITQNSIPNPSPYGINFQQNSAMEMPKALTSSSSEDSTFKLKRKRTNSESSLAGDKKNSKNISLVGRIVDSFKAPSKYSLESMSGLFTNTRNIANYQLNDTGSHGSISQRNTLSASLGFEIPKIPASKSEYRRLTIRNPREAFIKYDEIDANKVLLAKKGNYIHNTTHDNAASLGSRKVINDLKPPAKRVKSELENNSELNFTKPLFEQQKENDDGTTEAKTQSYQLDSETKIADSHYWCAPSISELSKMTSLELTHVQNFTAGRKNHGHLMFKYPVDLTAFEGRWDQLLGKTIVFQNRILQVYPDETEKPSQGNGLNVPAVITLEKVFPKRHNPKSPNSELLERHIERLKSAHGMKFISFDPLTGNYVFEVEHFSIWGIVDEEDDDPEIVARWRKQQELEQNNEKRKNELQINALEKIAGYGQPGDTWKRQKPDFGIITPGAFEFTEQENENNDELLLPGNKGDADGQNIFLDGNDDVIVDASVPTGLSENDDADDKEDGLPLLKSGSKLNDIDDLVEIRAYEPEVKDVDMQFINPKTDLALSENWDEQLHLSNGFFSAFNKNLDKRNNVKLDPKHVGDLIFGDKDPSKLKKAIVEPPLKFENSLQYQKCLQTEMLRSEFALRKNGMPQVVISSEVSLEVPLLSFENSDDYTFWELLSILYDDKYLNSFFSSQLLNACGSQKPKMEYIQELKKRELLCEFLQKLILLELETSFDSAVLSRDTLDKIYHFICTDKLGDAIQYAVNTRNNHIAVLLTMMDSNDNTVHKLAKSQLNVWSQESVGFIPSSVLKIYKLLSGEILSKEYIDHLEGLTWPVVLFLMIKYGNSNRPLNETLKDFVNYAERTGISELPIYQTHFTILKMVNSSREVLSSFDVELQFLLMRHLKNFIQFSSNDFDAIIQEFSTKLERKSMIKEASFVLEHLTNDEMAKEKLTHLFNSNVSCLGILANDKKLKELHEILYIPESLLHEARSVEYNKLGEYYKSTLELILADNLVEAHSLMLEKVAPDLIIRNVPTELGKLSKLVESFSTLSESKVGADVYGDYIKMVALSDVLDYNDADYDVKRERLKSAFESVLNGITSLVNTNRTVEIAKTLMIKKLISIAFKEELNTNTEQLLRLELPESEKNYLEAKIDDLNGDKLLTN